MSKPKPTYEAALKSLVDAEEKRCIMARNKYIRRCQELGHLARGFRNPGWPLEVSGRQIDDLDGIMKKIQALKKRYGLTSP